MILLVLHLVSLLNVYSLFVTLRRYMDLFFQLCMKGIILHYKDIMADMHLNVLW